MRTMSTTLGAVSVRWDGSSDEVDLVDHTSGLASRDTDEHSLVQPIEIVARCLDLGRRAEHVFTRVDILTASKASENLRAAVAHPVRTDIQQITVIGLQCVADISERCTVWQDDLPIRTGPRNERTVEFGPGECASGQGDDSPSPLRHVPHIEGLDQACLQTEDLRQARFGKPIAHHALLLGAVRRRVQGVGTEIPSLLTLRRDSDRFATLERSDRTIRWAARVRAVCGSTELSTESAHSLSHAGNGWTFGWTRATLSLARYLGAGRENETRSFGGNE